MKTTAAFWDASALVPLCVHEAASARARSHARTFGQVVWWGTQVEVHGAICRLNRAAEISDAERQGAVERLHLLSRAWREVLPSDELRVLAIQLLGGHSLRAADAIQLAAGLVWCDQRSSRRTFICGDRRLASSAESAGFIVLELA